VSDNVAATNLYRIAQEAISNAAQHGKAEHVSIQLAMGREQTRLRVQDDGVGFGEPAPAPHVEPQPPLSGEKANRGMGIRIMHHRARMMGGTLEIRPKAVHGTTVTCTLMRLGRGKDGG